MVYMQSSKDELSDKSVTEIAHLKAKYQSILENISNGDLQRGRDFMGGYDDSIANDLHACQLALGYRALVEYDEVAHEIMSTDDWRAVADDLLALIRNVLISGDLSDMEFLRYMGANDE